MTIRSPDASIRGVDSFLREHTSNRVLHIPYIIFCRDDLVTSGMCSTVSGLKYDEDAKRSQYALIAAKNL